MPSPTMRKGAASFAGFLLAFWNVAPASASNVQDISELLRRSPFQKLRAEEDCRSLADVDRRTLGADALRYWGTPSADIYGCLGGSFRLRYEWSKGASLEDRATDGVFLHRTMLHFGLNFQRWGRTFIELTAASASGRNGGASPVDQDLVDVHQAFAELTWNAGTWSVQVRGGRQELALGSGRLIDVAEGPNVRRPFEGIRLQLARAPWRIDIFGLRPIATRTDTFDNRAADGQWLWGAYGAVGLPLPPGGQIDLELYYLGFRDPDATYEQGSGLEVRHTVGARLELAAAGWDANVEAIVQFGEFEEGRILAWTAASVLGYRVADWPLSPRFGLSLNIASGDRDPDDPDLETFNALFQRGNYFGQLVIVGPANFFDVHPTITFSLSEGLLLHIDWEVFWRLSTEDAVYAVNRSILRGADPSSGRFVAHIVSAAIDWQLARHWSLYLTYGQLLRGSFIADAAGSEGSMHLVEASAVFTF